MPFSSCCVRTLALAALCLCAMLGLLPASSQAAIQSGAVKSSSIKLVNQSRAIVTVKNNTAGRKLLRQVQGRKVTVHCTYIVRQGDTYDVGTATRTRYWSKQSRALAFPFRASLAYRPYECQMNAAVDVEYKMSRPSPSDAVSEDDKFGLVLLGLLGPAVILEAAGYEEKDPIGPFDTQVLLAAVQKAASEEGEGQGQDACPTDPNATMPTFVALAGLMVDVPEACAYGVYGHKTMMSVLWKGLKWSDPGDSPDLMDGKTVRTVLIL